MLVVLVTALVVVKLIGVLMIVVTVVVVVDVIRMLVVIVMAVVVVKMNGSMGWLDITIVCF